MNVGQSPNLRECLAAALLLGLGGSARADNADAAGQVSVAIGRPRVVAQAPASERRWGFWQFPTIERLADGRILAGWHLAADSVREYGSASRGYAVSSDEGATWKQVDRAEVQVARGTLLPNGDRLLLSWGTWAKPLSLERVDLPEPVGKRVFNYGDQVLSFYLSEELPDEARKGWPQTRFAKGSASGVSEYPEVTIPGQVQVAREGVLVRPFFMGNLLVASDGALWTSCYWNRYIDGQISSFIPTFVKSADNGRTWTFRSDIPYQPDKSADPMWAKRDGFTEPDLAVMPDGSMLALMRTTDGNGPGPSYLARSIDDGKTWGRPQPDDDRGVLPQLLVLRDGFTLASYGRPGVFVRATADESGLTWGDRVEMALHKQDLSDEWSGSCGYTQLLALDGNTALLVYSDFEYPDRDGNPCKTILVRTIAVVREATNR